MARNGNRILPRRVTMQSTIWTNWV